MRFGGLLKSASLTALLAAAGLFGGGVSAKAADLGGDCCADLEERVAELEATTVRKGNRKVSVTLSGYVSHHVMFWDDGTQSDMYIGDGGNCCVGQLPTGIAVHDRNDSWSVHPVPASDVLIVDRPGRFDVLDINGRLIKRISAVAASILVNDLVPGSYQLLSLDDGERHGFIVRR